MSDEYEWRRKWRLEPDVDVDHVPEKTSIGWDLKEQNGSGDWYVIEYAPDGVYGTKGFPLAFREGSIDDLCDQYHDEEDPRVDGFTDFIIDYTWKNEAHEIIDEVMPEQIDVGDFEAVESEYVIAKPRSGANAKNVDVYRREEVDPEVIGDRVIEEFIESKPIAVEPSFFRPSWWTDPDVERAVGRSMIGAALGAAVLPALFAPDPSQLYTSPLFWTAVGLEAGNGTLLAADGLSKGSVHDAIDAILYDEDDRQYHDGCMRYVNGIEVETDGMIVEDLGGYWRTADEPLDSDAGLNERLISNLQTGRPVEASDEELNAAAEISLEAVGQMYRHWLEGKGYTEPGITVEGL